MLPPKCCCLCNQQGAHTHPGADVRCLCFTAVCWSHNLSEIPTTEFHWVFTPVFTSSGVFQEAQKAQTTLNPSSQGCSGSSAGSPSSAELCSGKCQPLRVFGDDRSPPSAPSADSLLSCGQDAEQHTQSWQLCLKPTLGLLCISSTVQSSCPWSQTREEILILELPGSQAIRFCFTCRRKHLSRMLCPSSSSTERVSEESKLNNRICTVNKRSSPLGWPVSSEGLAGFVTTSLSPSHKNGIKIWEGINQDS